MNFYVYHSGFYTASAIDDDVPCWHKSIQVKSRCQSDVKNENTVGIFFFHRTRSEHKLELFLSNLVYLFQYFITK